jgi:hypothetical protein
MDGTSSRVEAKKMSITYLLISILSITGLLQVIAVLYRNCTFQLKTFKVC